MPSRHGCSRTTNPVESADSAGGLALRSDILKCLVETLSMDTLSRPSVEQAKRLDATNFRGTTNPTEALFWLS